MVKKVVLLTLFLALCLSQNMQNPFANFNIPQIKIEDFNQLRSSNVGFGLNQATYTKGPDYWDIFIPVNGYNSGKHDINIENLPSGWKSAGNILSILSSLVNSEITYPLKCIVNTNTGVILRRTILLKCSSNGIFLNDYPYDYNFNSQSSSSLSSSGSYIKTSEKFSSDYSSSSSSLLRKEFDSLPQYTDLDKLIENGDPVLIIKTIQSVMQSNLNCQAKLGYLSDFLGRI
jgi:hypothetical protein